MEERCETCRFWKLQNKLLEMQWPKYKFSFLCTPLPRQSGGERSLPETFVGRIMAELPERLTEPFVRRNA